MKSTRRAVIMPVVLMVLMLIGLLGAMFAFRINADEAASQAVAFRMQTRLAAEAGIDRVKLLLRTARFDKDLWYHNPEELHRIIVWGHDTDSTIWGTNEEFGDREMVYRFSIVADDPQEDEDYIRIGITDEASKLNLNTATEEQLLTLVQFAVEGDEEFTPQEVVDAILDWRDADGEVRGEAADTEGLYYLSLDEPYRIKNGPFDSVEELLLVKGVTARLLYGEDFDRNGLLTPNEDDGDLSFPPDNQDGILNRGLYPYLTIFSEEDDVSIDNRQRIYLFNDESTVRTQLTEVFPNDAEIVDYIVKATRPRNNKEDKNGGNNNPTGGAHQRGSEDTSPSEMNRGASRGNTENGVLGKQQRLLQVRDPGLGDENGEEVDGAEADTDGDSSADTEGGDEAGDETGPGGGQESDDAGSGSAPIPTPAALLRAQPVGDNQLSSPLRLEHLPIVMDRLTTHSPEDGKIPGLINVNTASGLVLECIEGLTGEQIDAILEARDLLDPELKETTAWLVSEEVLDLDTFIRIAPYITARPQQFTIESLGYGDHTGMVSRIQVVVDMLGPIAQTVYYRDLTHLGGHYPIREEDLEAVRRGN